MTSEFSHSPVCTTENRASTGHRIRLTSIRLHADPTRVLEAKQVIYNLESLVLFRKVHRSDVNDALKLALRVIAKEGENGDDTRRTDVQRKLVLQDGELLNEAREGLHDIGAIVVQRLGCLCMTGDCWVGRGRLCKGRGGSCCEDEGIQRFERYREGFFTRLEIEMNC